MDGLRAVLEGAWKEAGLAVAAFGGDECLEPPADLVALPRVVLEPSGGVSAGLAPSALAQHGFSNR